VSTKIDNCKKYWNELVEPDYQEFQANQGDMRKAFHCAISLLHMADWVYKEKGPHYWKSIGLQFTDRTGAAVAVHDDKSFANALAAIDPNFELVRNIANSAKHFSLNKPGRHPSSPSHAANTYSSPITFSPSVFSPAIFDTTGKVMLEGPGGKDLLFLNLAKSVYETFQIFCAKHGVGLKAG
jgi:hypothetical protein